jgi:O-antigen ligase/tetratricopeptide (TPR) repeat protein
MARRKQPEPTVQKTKQPAHPPKPEKWYAQRNIAPLLVCLAYLGVHFVPDMDAYDAMGPQWLYIAGVDFLAVIYLLAAKDRYDEAFTTILRNIFSKLYLAYFAIAGISVFFAINQTEGWVCFVRLIATVTGFLVLAVVLYRRGDLFRSLAQMIALVLLVDAYKAFSEFLSSAGKISMLDVILNMKSTTGNKNIFAASMVVKVPFVIFGIHTGGLFKKILNIIILFLGILVIFLANARAAYLSTILISVSYLAFCTLEQFKHRRPPQDLIYKFIRFLVPATAALIVSTIELGNLKNLEENPTDLYGSVTSRLGSITATSDPGNNIRLKLWEHAMSYAIKHPVTGCGYGNWKIASIPYIRTITDDLYVPVHAHNDYCEAFAELGIPGGLLFLSLFVCITLFTFKTYFSKADDETRFISIFSFFAFMGYAVDAFFNFPIERPINQMFFVLITAININAYLSARAAAGAAPIRISTLIKPVTGLVALILLLPSAYVMYRTYQSLVIQRIIVPDMDHEPMQLKWQEIFPKIPDIPNLSASAQPIEAIKGRYLSEAGKYDEALVLLNRAIAANPTIAYSDFLKASLFYKQQQWDSSKANGLRAFYTRPRAKTYYQTLMAILAQLKDTANIQKVFDEYNRYRPSVFAWDLYLRAMLTSYGKGTPELAAKADSAYKKYATDPADTALASRKAEILRFMNAPTDPAAAQQQTQLLAKAQTYYAAGVAAFTRAQSLPATANKAAYLESARNFIRAGEIITNNYVIYENVGVSYFNMGEFKKAIPYFDRVTDMGTSHDGKSEYFKGVAYYNLGNTSEGCKWIRIASSKGYAEAGNVMKSNCK